MESQPTPLPMATSSRWAVGLVGGDWELAEIAPHFTGRIRVETLFSGIRVLGFREIEFELTPHGAALGLAEALPAAKLELRISGYGRGERI